VQDYGDVCQAVTELAAEQKVLVTVDEFRTLNRCLDSAIADAVTAFASGPDDTISEQAENWKKSVFSANEQRRLINVAIQIFCAIKNGNMGLTGATGAVLGNALVELRELIAQSPHERRWAGRTRTLPIH
jgi:hypothetical protein